MEPRSRSEETKEVDRNWVARLPGLEGLFAAEGEWLDFTGPRLESADEFSIILAPIILALISAFLPHQTDANFKQHPRGPPIRKSPCRATPLCRR
jgi:hypothetical protein